MQKIAKLAKKSENYTFFDKNQGFWGFAVSGEFGSVSNRLENMRDVFVGKI